MRRLPLLLLFVFVLALVAACDETPPSPTPGLSGPTLEASPVFNPVIPVQEPTQLRNLGQNDPTAAALPSGAELPPLAVSGQESGEARQSVQVTAADGTQLLGELYAHPLGERVPGILLIAPDRTAWLDLPLRLQGNNFTVLALDLRAPLEAGDIPPLSDFSAMLNALAAAGTVDPGRLAVIGAEAGADLALNGCVDDLLCDALALFSPQDDGTASAVLRLRGRPLFLAAAEGDAAYSTAQLMRANFAGELTFVSVSGAERGAALLQAQPSLGDDLIAWLEDIFGG